MPARHVDVGEESCRAAENDNPVPDADCFLELVGWMKPLSRTAAMSRIALAEVPSAG